MRHSSSKACDRSVQAWPGAGQKIRDRPPHDRLTPELRLPPIEIDNAPDRLSCGEAIDERVETFISGAADPFEPAHRLAAKIANDAALRRKLLVIDRLQ